MAKTSLRLPRGFDALPVDQQIDYVQSLWERIRPRVSEAAIPDWQRELIERRSREHREKPSDARPWPEVRARIAKMLRDLRG